MLATRTISMPGFLLNMPVYANLSTVMHAISHDREEQIHLVPCAMNTYSVCEHTYILKMYYWEKNYSRTRREFSCSFQAVQFRVGKQYQF